MANSNPSPETRFKPGQSGNPGGKTSKHVEAERKAAEIAALMRFQVLSSMQEKIDAGTDPMELLTGEAIRLFKDSEDRAHGTPKQSLQHGNDPDHPFPTLIRIEAASGNSDDPPSA